MADLYKIFNEEGLGGLLPYVLNETSHGYRILIDKIKAGHPLFFIRTQMEVPYIVVKNGTYQAMFYTTREKADHEAADLKAQGFDPTVEDLPDGKARDEALAWLFDHGPTHMLLDDSLSIPLDELTEGLPDYDGRPTTEHQLRNRRLNGATFYFLQQAVAGYGNMEAERAWCQSMVDGLFLAACINDPSRNYPALSIQLKGQTALLIYSDWRQVSLDNPEGEPACMVVDFSNLMELLQMDPNNILVLNNASCALTMDIPFLESIAETARSAAPAPTSRSVFNQNQGGFTLGQVPEDEWDTIDPTPDFLK